MDKKMTFVLGGLLVAVSFWLKDWILTLVDSFREIGLPHLFISLIYLIVLIAGLKLVADAIFQK